MQELMKKIVYAIAALALIFTGCAKELENTTKENFSVVRLRVTVADDATKVSADNDGRYHWQAGDKISVLNNSGKAFEFETEEGGAEVDFGATSFTGTLGSYAMHPSVSSNEAAGDVVSFHLPTTIDWVANATNMPMLGKIDENKATFRSVGGVLKLVCYNIPSGAAWLQFTATSQKIVGEFVIDGSEALPVLETENTEEAGKKELSIDFSGNYSSNMVFYIPLPTGTLNGFTIAFLDSELNELFSKTTVAAPTVARNQMIIAPALNCDPAIVLWRESFTNYANATTWASATAMSVGGSFDAEKYGDATITYQTEGSTSVRNGTNAGGTSPELSFGKTTPNTFTVAGIPTNGANSMQLTFNAQADCITVSSPTDGVSVTGLSYNSTDKLYTATVTNTGASTFTLSFNNTDLSDYKRIDNVKLMKEGSSATVPTITSGNVNLTIAIGQLSKSTSVGITNPVDNLGLSYVLSKKDDKPMDWISSVVISEGTLTVTATDANGEAEDREAILTLKATGATDRVINLKQTSALVQKPATISVAPGNARFTAEWTKADHATGYKAYLHTTETATPATGGTELTPSLDESTYSVTQSGLTNGSTYYLYVKVNTVDANYIAEDAYTMVSFTPDNVIYYERINSTGDLEMGVKYLIVYESGNVAFNGSLTDLDPSSNTVPVSIVDGKIVANNTINGYSFTIAGSTDEYVIRSASGYYIGRTASSNGLNSSTSEAYTNRISFSANNVIIKGNDSDGNATTATLQNYQGTKFRYYTSIQNAVQLYKLNDPRSASGLKWTSDGSDKAAIASASATMITGPDVMPAAALYNPNSLAVTYSSSDPSVATINALTGDINLVGAGSTIITASFPDGDASFKPAAPCYTLTVTDSRDFVDTPTFSDVTEDYPAVNVLAAAKNITISCGTAGATIYYTTGNSAFDPSSWTQNNTVSISGLTTVRAVAVKADCQNSAEAIVAYRIAGAASPLPEPSGLAVTEISASTLNFSWTNDANASDYEWVVSTSSTYAGIVYDGGSANVIDYGNTSDGDCSLVGSEYRVSLSALSLQGKYYIYVIAKGDGSTYSDSENASCVSKGILTLNQSGLNTPASYSSSETAATIGGFNFASIQTMKSTTSIQGKASVMKIYNKSSLGKVKSVVVTQAAGKTYRAGTLYVGDAVDPSTTTVTVSKSGSVATYNVTGDYGFFTYKNTSGNAMYIDNIVVVFE